MNALSLFDGMACLRVALQKLNVRVNKYYASEIDEYAMKIAKKNYPDIIHVGDVENWRNWDIDWKRIDILAAGSPCQGFSFAGKQLAFDDPRSKLFFVFIDILKHIQRLNPKVEFLLENVRMKKEYLDLISQLTGVQPVMINSATLSAQNRTRYYWCNWGVLQPRAEEINLEDILLDSPPSNLWHSNKALAYMGREVKGGRTHWDFKHHSDTFNPKSAAVVANFFKGVPYNVLIDRRNSNCFRYECDFQDQETCPLCNEGDCYQEGYVPTSIVRKFHPIECERLQTLPDNYTEGVSNTQRYKMIGNGWTVDVIVHILRWGGL